MFDIGWTELLVVGVVALIVVGPEDLPKMFRTLGRFTGRAKGLAREFTSAMNDAADSTGIKDIKNDLNDMTSKKGLGLDALDGMADSFEKWDPLADGDTDEGEERSMLTPDRAAAAKKIEAAAAKKASDRLAAEAEAAEQAAKAAEAPKPAAKKPAAKKPAAKKTAAKKAPAKKKPAAKKTAPKTGDKT